MSIERKARRMRAIAESKAKVKGWMRRKGFEMRGGRWVALGKLGRGRM